MNINTCLIVGRLVRDPELKTTPSGTKVTNLSIATSRSYTNNDGTKVDTPEFHSIVCFGAVAESVAKWLVKGQIAGVEGRLQTRSWDDKESGKKLYKTEIVANNVQFGPRSAKTGQGSEHEPGTVIDADSGEVRTATKNVATTKGSPTAQAKSKPTVGGTGIEYPTEDIDPSLIPF